LNSGNLSVERSTVVCSEVTSFRRTATLVWCIYWWLCRRRRVGKPPRCKSVLGRVVRRRIRTFSCTYCI